MIRVELGVTAVGTGPIQIQAVVAVDLLGLSTAVNLHGGLLVAVVASYIERAGCDARHLRDSGPWIAAARNVLKQVLVKRSRRLIVLQIDDWLSFHPHNVSDFPHLQFRIYCRREAGSKNYACFAETLKSFGGDYNLVSAKRQQIKEIRSIRPCSSGAFRHQRRAFDRYIGIRYGRSRSICNYSRDFSCDRHLSERQPRQEPCHENGKNEPPESQLSHI